MYTIQTLNKISPLGLNRLDPKDFTVTGESDNPDGILVRSADLHEMAFGSNLRAIAQCRRRYQQHSLGQMCRGRYCGLQYPRC